MSEIKLPTKLSALLQGDGSLLLRMDLLRHLATKNKFNYSFKQLTLTDIKFWNDSRTRPFFLRSKNLMPKIRGKDLSPEAAYCFVETGPLTLSEAKFSFSVFLVFYDSGEKLLSTVPLVRLSYNFELKRLKPYFYSTTQGNSRPPKACVEFEKFLFGLTTPGPKLCRNPKRPAGKFTTPPPSKIKSLMDKHVIGQEAVKKSLALHSFYYFESLQQKTNPPVPPPNIMLIGETGSGKTLLVKTLAQTMAVPFLQVDAPSITPSGYKGSNPNTIFRPLAFDHPPKTCEKGFPAIIFVDEFDKLIRKKDDRALGLNLQSEFLKIIEGGTINVHNFDYGRGPPSQALNTSQFMFIFAGSFPKLDRVVTERVRRESPGDFPEEILPHTSLEDLIAYGVNREFLGRISAIKFFHPLSKKMMMEIFTRPKNSIYNQCREKFARQGVELTITSKAIEYITEQALKNNTGARGLANITNNILDDLLYKIPGDKKLKKVLVDEKFAQAAGVVQ